VRPAPISTATAELLCKALSQESLDAALTKDDADTLIEYLRRAGALDDKARYHGSTRRGYAVEPGPAELEGRQSEPFDFGDLLRSKVGLYLQTDYDYQNSMFQVTHWNAWMQGAFQSARQVATAIHMRVGHEQPRRART
jgi:monoamine oxidase